MIDPISLLLLAMLANKGSANCAPAQRKVKKSAAPKWPTPKSPPPMPAFQARKTRPPKGGSADPGGTSTPLAQLARSPQPAPATTIDTAKRAATAAIKRRTTSLLKQQAARFNPFAKQAVSTAATSTALVSQLQKILASHGMQVTPDGLYGPRTASAWSTLAKRKGLPPAISREGPQIAKIVTQTFEQLSVPPIP